MESPVGEWFSEPPVPHEADIYAVLQRFTPAIISKARLVGATETARSSACAVLNLRQNARRAHSTRKKAIAWKLDSCCQRTS